MTALLQNHGYHTPAGGSISVSLPLSKGPQVRLYLRVSVHLSPTVDFLCPYVLLFELSVFLRVSCGCTCARVFLCVLGVFYGRRKMSIFSNWRSAAVKDEFTQ